MHTFTMLYSIMLLWGRYTRISHERSHHRCWIKWPIWFYWRNIIDVYSPLAIRHEVTSNVKPRKSRRRAIGHSRCAARLELSHNQSYRITSW